MSKYKRKFQEVNEQWNDQINFIQESIRAFDNRYEKEGRRLATAIRVTVPDSREPLNIYN